jgi:RNA polymerase sigma factor (sigma-70 family)
MAGPSGVAAAEVAAPHASISVSWRPETVFPRAAVPEIDLNEPDRSPTATADFAGIYLGSRTRLARRARRFLSDPRDIEEVVQETFLRLVLAMPEFEHEWQAQAFCNRVLTNLCIDRYRRDRRQPRMFELDSCAVRDIAGGDAADHAVLRAEDAAIVREGMALLSPLHRAALVKREIEEKSLPTIAAELGIAEASVKHLLFRARRSLRRLLAGSLVDPEIELTGGEVEMLGYRRDVRSSGASLDCRLVGRDEPTRRAFTTRYAS